MILGEAVGYVFPMFIEVAFRLTSLRSLIFMQLFPEVSNNVFLLVKHPIYQPSQMFIFTTDFADSSLSFSKFIITLLDKLSVSPDFFVKDIYFLAELFPVFGKRGNL